MTDMKNQQIRGILALLIVTVLSFGVIAGSRALRQDLLAAQNSGSQGTGQTVTEELEVGGEDTGRISGKRHNVRLWRRYPYGCVFSAG